MKIMDHSGEDGESQVESVTTSKSKKPKQGMIEIKIPAFLYS